MKEDGIEKRHHWGNKVPDWSRFDVAKFLLLWKKKEYSRVAARQVSKLRLKPVLCRTKKVQWPLLRVKKAVEGFKSESKIQVHVALCCWYLNLSAAQSLSMYVSLEM